MRIIIVNQIQCALPQGNGEKIHEFEDASAWRHLAMSTWLGFGDMARENVAIHAARLQAWYRTWLLPYEIHLMESNADVTATVYLPAGTIRRLAMERTQDNVLQFVVKYFAGLAGTEGDEGIQGHHDIMGEACALPSSFRRLQFRICNLSVPFGCY
jgi:hypothetical protein